VGAVLRAVRIRSGWRQADVAERARVSRATISRIERGWLTPVAFGTLERAASALEVSLEIRPRWRSGDLDRMLGAGHAALHAEIARLLEASPGWQFASEVSYSIYGERGAIDILATHSKSGALLVCELKTQLVDIQELLGAVDRYSRLARFVAAERGWRVSSVSRWVAIRDSSTNRRRVAAHLAVLRNAFPHDGRQLHGWLRAPAAPLSALSFLSGGHARNAVAASSGVRRVRRPASPQP
jgi:transcriptional regulator with XRE-family HTH domain